MPPMTFKEKSQAEKELKNAYEKLQRQFRTGTINEEDYLHIKAMVKLRAEVRNVKIQIAANIEVAKKYEGDFIDTLINEHAALYDVLSALKTNLPDFVKNEVARQIPRVPEYKEKVESLIRQKTYGLHGMVKSEYNEFQDDLEGFCNFLFGDAEKTLNVSLQDLYEFDDNLKVICKDIYQDVQNKIKEIKVHGLGRPWGTAYRQRIAAMMEVDKEVDSLLELAMNSLLNSKAVNLRGDFIKLIRKDPAIPKLHKQIEDEIAKKCRQKYKSKAINTSVSSDSFKISNFTSSLLQFGGERTPGVMWKQLANFWKFDKYKNTYKVALSPLTWSIRSCYIKNEIIVSVVYNNIGYAVVWNAKHSIEEKLDLRPSREGVSGQKLSFSETYNTVTSILGTVYHDWIGATDSLKVKVQWYSGSSFMKKW